MKNKMENAHTYKATVHAQITIFQEIEVSLIADSEEEFIELAKERYKEVMTDRYGWADYDDSNVDNIQDLGELPF